ncbi:hypothetical protein CDG81_10755 [Actinopolyspora erythraea]|uniref:Carboxymuconolactone decarboxylase family protein n=1 Tax=Actinopolyspora erythraea TaxID=414996 RepID=A0A223RS52_9ACTN|nr:carboxymuconolactone decarboxylase family protein [Actinopolyspora erythraea]ASU78677.1 hypothetical protein CDG81_10755 [Actinopolyspora erythraea]
MELHQDNRLPLLDVEDLSPAGVELREKIISTFHGTFDVVDSDEHMLGPFNAALYSPELHDLVVRLATTSMTSTSLSGREREIAVLTLAVQRDADYIWYAHERVARAAGLPESVLRRIESQQPLNTLDRREQTVQRISHSLVSRTNVPDSLYEEAVEVLGYRSLVELVTVVGTYELIALHLATFRCHSPDGAPGDHILLGED